MAKEKRGMKAGEFRYLSAKYLLAIILLLAALLTAYAYSDARRAQKNLMELMEQEGLALAGTLEISSKNAILGNRLLEDMIAQRLFDNARLIDTLLATDPTGFHNLAKFAADNRLHLIEVRGPKGELIADNRGVIPLTQEEKSRPPRTPMMESMMGRMMGRGPEMMGSAPFQEMITRMRERGMFYQPIIEGRAVEARQGFGERKFWQGKDYGIAAKRQAAPGMIVIMADAQYILNFRKEIGLQKLINDLKGRPGIEYISLQDSNFLYLAHTDLDMVGKTETGPSLRTTSLKPNGQARVRLLGNGHKVLEVTKPFALDGTPLGTIRVGLSLSPLVSVWRKSVASILLFAGTLLAAGMVGTFVIFLNQRRHVREVRALEAQMGRSEKLAALGNLAAGVAHEIRNPLNAIAMGIQRLKGEFLPEDRDEEYGKFIDIIRGEVARLDGIVDRFLQLARPSRPIFQPCHLNSLIAEVAELMRGEAETKGIALRTVIPHISSTVSTDGHKLKQALMNVVLNALQATEAGGAVTLSVDKKEGEYRMGVTDTGVGIPHSSREEIFDPYFTTKEKGMGLGLFLAQSIMQELGGRIELESEPGKGSTLTLILPVTDMG